MTDPVRNMKWALHPLGDVTQWFGESPELYQKYTKLKSHNGVDIVRPHGEHLFAVEGGVVTEVKDTPDGYGRHIRILTPPDSHGEAREWTYAHLSYIGVKNGQAVKEGQFVAKMGNTGFVVSNADGNGFWKTNPYAGTHLHLGCRNRKNGRVVNYDNGWFGSYDPVPVLLDPSLKSTKVFSLAFKSGDNLLFRLALLLRTIGL